MRAEGQRIHGKYRNAPGSEAVLARDSRGRAQERTAEARLDSIWILCMVRTEERIVAGSEKHARGTIDLVGM